MYGQKVPYSWKRSWFEMLIGKIGLKATTLWSTALLYNIGHTNSHTPGVARKLYDRKSIQWHKAMCSSNTRYTMTLCNLNGPYLKNWAAIWGQNQATLYLDVMSNEPCTARMAVLQKHGSNLLPSTELGGPSEIKCFSSCSLTFFLTVEENAFNEE